MNPRTAFILVAAHVLACSPALPVIAQSFPSKPVRLVVPFPPSGSVDVAARALQPALSKTLGQSVVVENRPGASTMIGTEHVAKAPADGHTLLIAGFTFVANAAMRSKLPFDAQKDFVGVARIGTDPYIISIHPSLPARTVGELVALAKSKPGQLTYATNGAGSAQHVTGELLKQVAGIDMLHVPYQGGAPSSMSVLGGHNPILISTIVTAIPHVSSGKLRAIAVTSRERSEHVKDVPTLAASGYPEFELTSKLGLFARSGTAKEIIDRLSTDIIRVLQNAEVRENLLRQGISATPMASAEYDAMIRAEIPRIQKIVRQAGIRLD